APGFNAVEIASGDDGVEKDEAKAAESAEALWDALLSAGWDVRAVAADDAHFYHGSGIAQPGRAWVEAWADQASEAGICRALGAGRLYASTGPRLKSFLVKEGVMTVEVDVRDGWDPKADRVEFLKAREGGKEALAGRSRASTAVYRLDGREGYVRARIVQGG